MPRNAPHRRPRRRAAYSLVEVVAAIALMSATLVPAMELVRDGMQRSAEADRRQLLALYAVSQLEHQLAATAAAWASATYTGDYASEGHASIRYTTVLSDATVDGGVPGQLMALTTTVYDDTDGDDTLDADELSCVYQTKLGRFATYEALSP